MATGHRHISILRTVHVIFHLPLAKPRICRFIECEAPASQPILLKDVALRESSGNWAPKKLGCKVVKVVQCQFYVSVQASKMHV